MIKVITFDLDDTLWDAKPVLLEAERVLYDWLAECCPKVVATYSLPALRELRIELMALRPDLAHQITESRRIILQSVMQQTGMDQQLAQRKSYQGIDIFLTARHQVEIYPVIEPLLSALSDTFVLGALTNGNADINRLAIGHYFSFAYSAEMLDSSKPSPAHFEQTEKTTRATGEEILHVGDHIEHDIYAAKIHGWHTIWLNRGSADHPTVIPSATIKHINELSSAIQRLTDSHQ
jgi:HAD superfamily hydrolase (TIGR01549 family)